VNPVAAGPVADVVSAVLMLGGALSCLLGAIGLVRLPDLPARLQAATKPQTLGLSLILLGTALRVELASAVTLVLVVLFQVITAPVISQLVGRAAYRSGGFPDDTLVVDELAEHLPADAVPTTTSSPNGTCSFHLWSSALLRCGVGPQDTR
jgi:multicomponent Na+:H+ antiporter subunit G